MRAARPLAGLIAALALSLTARAADVPSPQAHLGYRPGDDFHLAEWKTVTDYFQKVDEASDRVVVRELGRTTEDRPYIVAIVSSPETCRDLARFRDLQHRLADPRIKAAEGAGDGDRERDPVAESKAVVLITCSIHSTETASTLMAMELLHELATRDDAAARQVLDRTILLLVPSANPDGVDKVARWYERSKGHPWEGSGMPELYHKYAGHDTNRDWFMLNLKETQLLTRLLYHEWFPTLTYDVHQMGSRGARLFVPPFHDPINPNLDPRIHQWIALTGAHMAADLAAAGKRGVLTHAMYDNWWNGGNRTTPQRHNMVGVLTEAASVRMASPIFLDKDELRGATRGFGSHQPATNFVDPWPGGWWRLRDIIDYELISARAVLTLAARYHDELQTNYRAMARDAIARGRSEPPFAWVVPQGQRDDGTATDMVRILHRTGIEVYQAESPFQAAGRTFQAGSWILPAAQPYRTHLKDMMERQVYPNRLDARGEPEPPYDVSGWTLPLEMGVQAVEVADAFPLPGKPVEQVEIRGSRIDSSGAAEHYMIENQSNSTFPLLNALLAAGVEPMAYGRGAGMGHAQLAFPPGTLRVPVNGKSKKVLDELLPRVSTRVWAVPGSVHPLGGERHSVYQIAPERLGVYQPWVPSMDEGWTRLVLERFGFPYTTLHNADIRAGATGLRTQYDVILIPSITAKTLREGYGRDQTEPEYTGGLGSEGADALRGFVEHGGSLVCLGDSCTYAIEALGLPVKEVLKGLPASVVYGPGCIVRVRMTARLEETPLGLGVPEDVSAYFDRSLAFELDPRTSTRTIAVARYAETDLLQSGWLLGASKIQGKAAVVEVPRGDGLIILFGFPPQHRGQTHGTFRLLFNALLRRGMRRE